MLLPSAFPCDSSPSQSQTRLQQALLASPPASPPQLSTHTNNNNNHNHNNAPGNMFTTCRSLQSLLATATAHPQASLRDDNRHMLTPPLSFASVPPKLRLRTRKPDATASAAKRVVKRVPATVARGLNKRRRGDDDDKDDDKAAADGLGGECAHESADLDHAPAARCYNDENNDENNDDDDDDDVSCEDPGLPALLRPTTPKRARIAPEVLPLGLERADYHALDLLHDDTAAAPDETEPDDATNRRRRDGDPRADEWTAEDDRMLVELVLEKLRLTKSDWQECARSLGKGGGSVSRRWKSLMIGGEIGLRRSSRRSKIHGTWR